MILNIRRRKATSRDGKCTLQSRGYRFESNCAHQVRGRLRFPDRLAASQTAVLARNTCLQYLLLRLVEQTEGSRTRYRRRQIPWPVIPAISSKSLSTWRTVSRAVSAAAAMSRSGIEGARCCPRSARLRSTSTARFSAAGVRYSTGIRDNGGRSNSSPISSADLAEYPASSSVIVVTCTWPRSMRSAHSCCSWQSPKRTNADLSISHGLSVTTTPSASHPDRLDHGQADRPGEGLRA